MRIYTLILGFSALVIAACAAFFSVSGIASLFAGNFWEVAIMAGALELGKLVAASFLYRYWKASPNSLKIYLLIGTFALMVVTSAGIFGFLSASYEETAGKLRLEESEVSVLEQKKEFFQSDITRLENRLNQLQEVRSSQTRRLDSLYAGENWISARRTEANIDDTDETIGQLNQEITAKTDSISTLNNNILEIQAGSDIAAEIGPLKYVARTFNVDIDTAVKYFIFMLIFVFDPMAISLVIAYNVAIGKRYDEKGNVIGETGMPETTSRKLMEISDNVDQQERASFNPSEFFQSEEAHKLIKQFINANTEEPIKSEEIDITNQHIKNVDSKIDNFSDIDISSKPDLNFDEDLDVDAIKNLISKKDVPDNLSKSIEAELEEMGNEKEEDDDFLDQILREIEEEKKNKSNNENNDKTVISSKSKPSNNDDKSNKSDNTYRAFFEGDKKYKQSNKGGVRIERKDDQDDQE